MGNRSGRDKPKTGSVARQVDREDSKSASSPGERVGGNRLMSQTRVNRKKERNVFAFYATFCISLIHPEGILH